MGNDDQRTTGEAAAAEIVRLLQSYRVDDPCWTQHGMALRIIQMFKEKWPELRRAAHQLHAAIEREKPPPSPSGPPCIVCNSTAHTSEEHDNPVLVTRKELRDAIAGVFSQVESGRRGIIDRFEGEVARIDKRMDEHYDHAAANTGRIRNIEGRLSVKIVNEALFGDSIKPGDRVRKKGGYPAKGVVLVTYRLPDDQVTDGDPMRAVVNIEPQGFQHIYRFDQLEVIGRG